MKKYHYTKKKKLTNIQKIIIFIISFLFVLVVCYLIYAYTHTPENMAKSKIENLASNYYENFLYQNIIESGEKDPARVLESYKDTGLSIVYLRQLLIHKETDDTELMNFLTEQCDENKTSVKYYPEPPYTKTSYRIEYNYSCEF
jgi:hypothetical protein